jgi:hypothetical protein
MFKQLGCVTSIYDQRHGSNHREGDVNTTACDPFGMHALPLRSLLRNEEKIDASFPGIIELMEVFVYILACPCFYLQAQFIC